MPAFYCRAHGQANRAGSFVCFRHVVVIFITFVQYGQIAMNEGLKADNV